MRDGADHLISVAYNHECLATCPVTAVVVVVFVYLTLTDPLRIQYEISFFLFSVSIIIVVKRSGNVQLL